MTYCINPFSRRVASADLLSSHPHPLLIVLILDVLAILVILVVLVIPLSQSVYQLFACCCSF